MKWQPRWPEIRQHYIDWWAGHGLVCTIPAPADKPLADVPAPAPAPDLETAWLDPEHRRQKSEHALAHRWYGGDAFPSFDPIIGPGSLGTFLGARPVLEPTTVWYEPCIDDPDSYPAIVFDPDDNEWLDKHLALIDVGLESAQGRYPVGMPDLIENVDVVAAMRGSEQTLFDMIERPAWVERAVDEINQAFFDAFDLLYDRITFDGGNIFQAFGLWGPGKTAKVQCDFACMISVDMFDRFVAPALQTQCDWLDYAMFHLDGTNAMQHLDTLLAIDSLDAIEWTPQAGIEGGGNPRWYDLYKRIKAGGKAVQAVGVRPDEVVPLLDAVGPEGMFICTGAPSQADAQALAKRVNSYR